jgi:hypothetical protein
VPLARSARDVPIRWRTTTARHTFDRRLTELLADRAGIRPHEKVAVIMTENQPQGWFFGHGQPIHLDRPREAWL